jgi:S1-C subfamily serine protease
MSFLKRLLIAIALVSSILLVGYCVGCTPSELSPRTTHRPAVTAASVVTLVKPALQRQWAPLASEQWLDSGFRRRWVPCCNAFAVRGPLLVTAAHCVADAELGAPVRYIEPSGLGLGTAWLVSFDTADDRAVLEPAPSNNLAALATAFPPRMGEPALSVSSYYSARSEGHVVARLGSGYFETSQTIIHGWSGSPALDADGRVWGIVSHCRQSDGAKECEPGRTIVAPLGPELVP